MQAEDKFRGNTGHCIKDIVGCFPNMPKEKISFAIMDLTEKLKKEGFEGIAVPHRKSEKCSWVKRENKIHKGKTLLVIFGAVFEHVFHGPQTYMFCKLFACFPCSTNRQLLLLSITGGQIGTFNHRAAFMNHFHFLFGAACL